jgi:malonate-semialdehyde dehydrogenase (acetylating)/methylmalonate-semialdehyde dehydrogenase
MMIQNYIGGQWLPSSGETSVNIIDPANGKVIGKTPLGTARDVAAAVDAAAKAFPGWRATPAMERVQYLFRLKMRMEESVDELSRLITQEHGKTLLESKGSVRRAIQMVETACGIPSLMMGENFEDIATGIDSSSVRRPLGVFAGIGPFNFPAMVPFWFWPFAVACGNTFVLKPSERVPLTSIRIFELLAEIGFPSGVMNLVHGGKDVVDALCTHPQVKGVSFVGSTPVARHVYTLGTSTGKRVQAFGGAKNFMVVMPDSLESHTSDRTVATAIESITGCAGERCLAGSLVLSVGDETYKTFQEKALAFIKKIKVGPGMNPENNMGPLISQEAKDRVKGLISRAIDEGAKVLLDGRVGVDDSVGYFLKPTVLADITSEMEIAQTEVFGPVILLGKVKTLDESVRWINSLPLANTTTLFTNSGAHARYFCYHVDPSMIGINIGVPAPMAFFSFGGSKDSFFGDTKAHGKSCVNFFTDTYTAIHRWYNEGGIW